MANIFIPKGYLYIHALVLVIKLNIPPQTIKTSSTSKLFEQTADINKQDSWTRH